MIQCVYQHTSVLSPAILLYLHCFSTCITTTTVQPTLTDKEPGPASAQRLINRELSWLDFNHRVLEEALDPAVPPLERLKFLAIFASNLDEFFMVRVALVRRAIEAGLEKQWPDGLSSSELMDLISARVHHAHESLGDCYRNKVLPALAANGIVIVTDKNISNEQRGHASSYFASTLQPLLSPLILDETRSFPQLENGALYFCIESRSKSKLNSEPDIALLRVPAHVVGRFVKLSSSGNSTGVIMIDDVIRLSLDTLFPGDDILGCYEIKIVRDSELDLDEVGSSDLLNSIIEGLQRRKQAPPTRFLYDPAMPSHLIEQIAKRLKVQRQHMFIGAKYHSFSDFMQLPSVVNRPDLLYPSMPPVNVSVFESGGTIIDVARKNDVLLHHPYQNFSYVVRFLEEAANDPAVVAIKGTLYRVSSDSHIAAALALAARNGKHVTVLVELKARFDEERNIGWARVLEEAGVHVIYGVKNLKTHCKVMLVVRKEGDVLKHYCHLGTGNYNDRTARLYCDLGLFTGHKGITADIASLFGRITGEEKVVDYKHLLVAPELLRAEFVRRIRRETDHARAGKPSGIIAKMNSLVDPQIIEELYLAGQAGVNIQLIVRGICCLRPEVPGLSENIRVISIIDRFLEHARVYRFENGGEPELFLASADWMPRNLNSRIEVAFPILDPNIREQIMEMLSLQLADNVKARVLHADGTNHRKSGEPSLRSQFELYASAQRATE